MEEPKKMDLRSMDITEEHKAKLKGLFPNVFNEDKVDFERLRQTLGEDVDVGLERFGLTWPGKAECMKIIQQPSIGTLKPCKEESVNFDNTENLFIEGDNLEVLKLLQKSYYGNIKMIYIDPPYNTGKEFIYPDKYSESLETYLAYTGQVDAEGKKFSTNTEADGRFHSKWLNMMYPRLFLARNLLMDGGVIFVSIDDNEVSNLRKICDEVFGEENFFVQIPWQSRTSVQNDTDMSVQHEYLVAYARIRRQEHRRLKESNADVWHKLQSFAAYPLPLDESRYSNPDNDPRGPWKADPFDAPNIRENLTYKIVNPKTGEEFLPPDGRCWRTEEPKYKDLLADGRILFGKTGESRPQLKVFYEEKKQYGEVPNSWFDGTTYGTATNGTQELQDLFGGSSPFSFPKPTSVIKALLSLCTKSGDLVLDFFVGSGTTAHSVFEVNKDGGNRKFICVQLPEPCADDSEDCKARHKTIAEIGKDRIRRVIEKVQRESAGRLNFDQNKMDLGFKVFKLDQSNFKIWDGAIEETADGKKIEKQLEFQIEHINPKATEEDILYELLLKSGFPLTTKVEILQLAGKKVYSIESGALLICLEKNLTKEVITEMARKEPARVICLDIGFSGNDQLKTNAVQIMKSHKVEDFRTV